MLNRSYSRRRNHPGPPRVGVALITRNGGRKDRAVGHLHPGEAQRSNVRYNTCIEPLCIQPSITKSNALIGTATGHVTSVLCSHWLRTATLCSHWSVGHPIDRPLCMCFIVEKEATNLDNPRQVLWDPCSSGNRPMRDAVMGHVTRANQ